MGEVYKARDPRLERDIALKVLPAATLTDDTARARMLREARMAARLNHPNVCTIHEVGESDGQVYIAMELVEGRSLAELLAGGALPTEQALRYGAAIAGALDHAHARGDRAPGPQERERRDHPRGPGQGARLRARQAALPAEDAVRGHDPGRNPR